MGDLRTESGLSVQQLIEIADHSTELKMISHAVDLFDGILRKCTGPSMLISKDCLVINVTAIELKLEKVIKEVKYLFAKDMHWYISQF